jgi:hypothetical protein
MRRASWIATVVCSLLAPAAALAQQPPPETPPPEAPPPGSEPTETPPAAAEGHPVPTQVETAPPPAEEEKKPVGRMEIYGFAMTDFGYDFNQVDPDWFDTLRPTKLPAFDDEFGEDGRWFAGVRQTRFGVKAWYPTKRGELKTTFEFEMFGVGADAGQTTIRLRHAYGELGQFGAGQYWSPFMDIDVFPNSVEYWGPPGMAFFRNVQVRWMPIATEAGSRVTVALERPGASGDTGRFENELQDIQGRFPLPDLSAEGRYAGKWGYVELAGIVRYIKWDDLGADAFDEGGDAIGWGLNLSTNIKLTKLALIKAAAVYGEAIQNYMNDATVDIGVHTTGDPADPFEGEALPLFGLTAFVDFTWSKLWSTSVGYSLIWMDNSNGQAPDAFHLGQYALANLLWYPTDNVMLGGELQWGRRDNFDDDFDSNDFRVQFSFKFNFSQEIGEKQP